MTFLLAILLGLACPRDDSPPPPQDGTLPWVRCGIDWESQIAAFVPTEDDCVWVNGCPEPRPGVEVENRSVQRFGLFNWARLPDESRLGLLDCLNGPAASANDECRCRFDHNDDGRVDLPDVAYFQRSIG